MHCDVRDAAHTLHRAHVTDIRKGRETTGGVTVQIASETSAARDVTNTQQPAANPPSPELRQITDDELVRLRGLLAAVPARETQFSGIAKLVEQLYDDLVTQKCAKRLSWKEMARYLSEWGHPVTTRTLYSALAKVRKKRALRLQPGRGNRRDHPAVRGLSVRSIGRPDRPRRLELVRTPADVVVATDPPDSAIPTPTQTVTSNASSTPPDPATTDAPPPAALRPDVKKANPPTSEKPAGVESTAPTKTSKYPNTRHAQIARRI
jgi:hypothetical protein